MSKKSDNKIKGKIAPALLSALAVALTVFVFGPFELYANNMAELAFGLGDFFGAFLLIAAGVTAILFLALIFLPRRVFDVACTVLSAVALLLYVQGTFLTLGMTSVEGDGVGGGTVATSKLVINAIVWIIILGGAIAASVIFSKKASGGVRTAIIFVMVVILGMQTVSFAAVAATTEGVFGDRERYLSSVDMLTYDGIEEVGEEKNVVYFVVDRFSASYFDAAMSNYPEIFDELEGFTYYEDAVSLYPRTYPAVTYMITGVEQDFSRGREEYLKAAWSGSEFLDILDANGYSVNVYTDSYYAYDATAVDGLPDYIANRSGDTKMVVSDHAGLRVDMARLSLYRYLPFSLRSLVGRIASDDFSRHIELISDTSVIYTSDMKAAYDQLSENPMTVKEGKNFSFIHLQGTHLPNKYDRNFNPATEDNEHNPEDAMIQSFKIIDLYIKQLKELGLYEDATIIITGDHSSIGSDVDDPYYAHLTALMIKPSGVGEGEMEISSAPVSQVDLHATILDSVGIDAELGYGESIFDISEDSDRVRKYYFQRIIQGEDGLELVNYEIVGSAADFSNWKVVERIKLESELYD